MLELSIDKDKLPRGLSYPTKSSYLQQALQASGIHTPTAVHYWVPNHPGDMLLECHFWLPNAHVPFRRFYLRIAAVEANRHAVANSLLQTQVLPALLQWMHQLQQQPDNSTRLRHDLLFKARLQQGGVTIHKD